ncbi:MAG: tetratricopeptide repeat protein, partial [Thermodesulfobacteriota bacterium]|nr:tetratricopeptide repeat protein [Thermodesulfobacteriota bacterium]
KAFFQGIQYMLSNDTDQAIEQFTKSVQINSDTVETYIALSNIYRSKGDFETAIKIRQGIILRPNLDKDIRLRAILDLGSDYRKGGFLQRAISTFKEVLNNDPNNIDALDQIGRIYEDVHDWDNAFKTKQIISRLVKGEYKNVLAHYQTELGKIQEKNNDNEGAEKAFKKAIYVWNKCIDAYLHLGDIYFKRKEYKRALTTWKKVADIEPQFTFLAYQRLEKAFSDIINIKYIEDFLFESAHKNSHGFTHLSLAKYLYNKGEINAAIDKLNEAITLFPSFLDARKFMGEILLKEGRDEEALEAYRELLSKLDFPYLTFQCSNCGFMPDKLVWKCPQCQKWDTIKALEPSSSELSSENTIP